MKENEIICCIRYSIDLDKLVEFEEYAAAWISLVNKYGGKHWGYFRATHAEWAKLSFPGVGRDAPPNLAIAIFSFPHRSDYEQYRNLAVADPLGLQATELQNESRCILDYERSFLRPMGAS